MQWHATNCNVLLHALRMKGGTVSGLGVCKCGCDLLFGDGEKEGTAFSWYGFHPDAATVQIYNFFALCQTYPRPWVFFCSVESLKYRKDSVLMFWGDANAVVTDRKEPMFLGFFCLDFDMWWGVWVAKFDGIFQQVLEEHSEFYGVGFDCWELVIGDRCIGFCDDEAKIHDDR